MRRLVSLPPSVNINKIGIHRPEHTCHRYSTITANFIKLCILQNNS